MGRHANPNLTMQIIAIAQERPDLSPGEVALMLGVHDAYVRTIASRKQLKFADGRKKFCRFGQREPSQTPGAIYWRKRAAQRPARSSGLPKFSRAERMDDLAEHLANDGTLSGWADRRGVSRAYASVIFNRICDQLGPQAI